MVRLREGAPIGWDKKKLQEDGGAGLRGGREGVNGRGSSGMRWERALGGTNVEKLEYRFKAREPHLRYWRWRRLLQTWVDEARSHRCGRAWVGTGTAVHLGRDRWLRPAWGGSPSSTRGTLPPVGGISKAGSGRWQARLSLPRRRIRLPLPDRERVRQIGVESMSTYRWLPVAGCLASNLCRRMEIHSHS